VGSTKHSTVALLVAKRGEPLAGDGRGGADLGRQLRGVKVLVACQLPAQVGVGDLVAHQPRPQF
jgi:hypothetical protein